MTGNKERLTVTVDPELLRAGQRAVAAGAARSLSAWVNLALAERVAREERLRAMGEAIARYAAAFGELTGAELAAQQRADRASSPGVRSSTSTTAPPPPP